MKNYLILFLIFISFISLAYSGLFEQDLLGGTQLNGNGCVCHTTEQDTTVSVWIEGPDTLLAGETGIYRMYLANGPAEAGGHNVAGRFGIMSLVDTLSVWDSRSPNELTQAFPLVFPTPQDTIYWEFAYTVPDSVVVDTLYSCGLSLVYDHIPDLLDRWNFGPKFPITVVENIVPVEMISFTSAVSNNQVLLNWISASELNNSGFQVERRIKNDDKNDLWVTIGFVNGNGTTSETKSYSYIDENLPAGKQNLYAGKYQYRLKQIDFDGSSQYSKTIEVEFISKINFVLEQNYPNPFNPKTVIKYRLPFAGNVILKVYDVLGNEVAVLVNEYKSVGEHKIDFNAVGLSSGIYFYYLKSGDFTEIKKMTYLK
ncbi:MAG: choice-of-anchor V domain-containing protein [Ignavibacteriaceae bacterium]